MLSQHRTPPAVPNGVLSVNVSNADYAAILFTRDPETGAPVGYARAQVLYLLYDRVVGTPVGCLTTNGYFAEALIEDPYGAVFLGRKFWPDIETFLREEVMH